VGAAGLAVSSFLPGEAIKSVASGQWPVVSGQLGKPWFLLAADH
jgi:hypothetical protein